MKKVNQYVFSSPMRMAYNNTRICTDSGVIVYVMDKLFKADLNEMWEIFNSSVEEKL